jgi:protein-S-isoprenylcysteine O-methyltransferase Ste14
MWILRHAFAILVLPVTVAVFVPLWLARRAALAPGLPTDLFGWLCVVSGSLLAVAGLVLFATTLRLFATRGRGTLAPWDPPVNLVVEGPYRYVRNPMIAGVLLVIAGEALILRSPVHGEWVGLFFLMNAVYFPLFEEPQLESRFGDEYREYKKNVPRFLPRLRPWIPRPVRLDIHPGEGIGHIRLGMRPAQVLAMLPEPQVYEDWMGGNLNDALLFHGLCLQFDRCDSRAPLPDSTLSSVIVHQREDAYLFDRLMGEWTKEGVLKELRARGYNPQASPNGYVDVPRKLSLSFDEEGRLVLVNI